jgi:outer membrane immunogenic protein
MNKLFLGSVALAAMIAGPAMAADMPVKYKAPPPVWSWSGCYVGAQIGASTGRSSHTYAGLVNGAPTGLAAGTDITGRFNVNGGLGGGEAGCNYQFGAWVVGVEVDGSWVSKEGQAFNLPPGFVPTFVSKTSERWLATARGRIGYSQDKWLLYVTGGGAWAGIDVAQFFGPNPAGTGFIQPFTRSGWVVGAGVEYALPWNWSWKAEYLYVDFGTFRAFENTLPFAYSNRDVKLSEHIFRFGLNYKFDWLAGPVYAKY